MSMATTIQVSEDLLGRLKAMKTYDSESYEDIIWELIEDHLELSAETKKNIAQAEKEIKEGKTISFEEVKKRVYSKIHTSSRKTTN
jgi:predicted transcriptional regulator